MEEVQEELEKLTRKGDFELMPNGEKRYRILVNDKLIYSATVAEQECGWQNAHYHTDAKETYFLKRKDNNCNKRKRKIILKMYYQE